MNLINWEYIPFFLRFTKLWIFVKSIFFCFKSFKYTFVLLLLQSCYFFFSRHFYFVFSLPLLSKYYFRFHYTKFLLMISCFPKKKKLSSVILKFSRRLFFFCSIFFWWFCWFAFPNRNYILLYTFIKLLTYLFNFLFVLL